jgi:hypothetical protein
MRAILLWGAVAAVMGTGWALGRGPDVSERINAVEMQGAGSGSTTLALAQAANRRSSASDQYERAETAVPAAAREPAAAPTTQPSPSPDQ